ncbi:MAG TPA: sugar ABC transporter ATP-binding protein [Lentisphaeria bacterium]|nr:MAG: sugar ABC transporter ATP-binding protein [Lentisphaerae bacterium GWF2_50_93]HCE45165.1 sugar ABC transporter ATP-binding protein [Lentisphaeria bacterium]
MGKTVELLEAKGIVKTFPGVKALSGVDFSVSAGEVHALMGENGAGKSTLVKIITGVYRKDAGEIIFNGKSISPGSTLEAEQCGISTVYQEVNLVPELSVAENICLGRQPKKLGFISWGGVRKRAVEALKRLELDIDVSKNLSYYSIAIQQLIAIARALDIDSKLLILDEPTSSLDEKEVAELFKMLKKLRGQGLGIVFITHFLDQVYQISDRITILRDGGKVGTFEAARLPRLEMVGRMIGKDPEQVKSMEKKREIRKVAGKEFLKAEGIGRKGMLFPMALEIREGEIIGLAGLLGSGRSETARMLFGVDPSDSGKLSIGGADTDISSPKKAVKNGIAMTAEDRKVTGIISDLTIRENIVLALQARAGAFRTYTLKEQYALADKFIKALGIKTPDADQLIKNLSGGNQQKALLARWLAMEPRLFMLDEPTRGIDVGAKAEIEKVMDELCEKGMALLFISSEMEEVSRNCDRVMVLRDRRKIGEISGEDISLQAIMKMIAE